jgi:drug/metabolite transporter (DMT)-like permease
LNASPADQAAPARGTETRVWLVLALGVVAVSSAAILVRQAQRHGAPSLFIAAFRLTASALLLAPFAWRRHAGELRGLTRRDLLWAGLAGVFLAVHFAAWIWSLEFASVLVCGVFVWAVPLWVALLEVVALRTALPRWTMVGLCVATAGGLLVGLQSAESFGGGSNPALGAGLATVGAAAEAAYLIVGRKLSGRMALTAYLTLVYGAGAAALLLALAVVQPPLDGLSATGYGWLFAVALVPQLIGHSSFNFALRRLSATIVSMAAQMEPALGAVLAFAVLRERPAALQIVGGLVVFAGTLLAVAGPPQRQSADGHGP